MYIGFPILIITIHWFTFTLGVVTNFSFKGNLYLFVLLAVQFYLKCIFKNFKWNLASFNVSLTCKAKLYDYMYLHMTYCFWIICTCISIQYLIPVWHYCGPVWTCDCWIVLTTLRSKEDLPGISALSLLMYSCKWIEVNSLKNCYCRIQFK